MQHVKKKSPRIIALLDRIERHYRRTTLKGLRKMARDQTHELPEYTNTWSKLSLMTPRKLWSVDYSRANRSVPDLMAWHRDRVFSEAYNQHSRTVPNFTRIDFRVPDASRPGDYVTIFNKVYIHIQYSGVSLHIAIQCFIGFILSKYMSGGEIPFLPSTHIIPTSTFLLARFPACRLQLPA